MKNLPLAFVIEDDEVVAEIFSTAVKEASFDAVVIRDGNLAMEALKGGVPDLVVLDLHLPGVSGINILRKIRNDQRLAHTRVLIISADTTQSEFLRIHADHVMIKPVGFHALRELALQVRSELRPQG